MIDVCNVGAATRWRRHSTGAGLLIAGTGATVAAAEVLFLPLEQLFLAAGLTLAATAATLLEPDFQWLQLGRQRRQRTDNNVGWSDCT